MCANRLFCNDRLPQRRFCRGALLIAAQPAGAAARHIRQKSYANCIPPAVSLIQQPLTARGQLSSSTHTQTHSIVFLEMADIWIPSHHIVGSSQLTLVPSSWIPTTTTRNILPYYRRQGLTLLA